MIVDLTTKSYYFFISFLALNFILFPSIIFAFLSTLDRKQLFAKEEIAIYAIPLAPSITALILYYTILLFPHEGNLFYASTVFIIYIAIFVSSFKKLPAFYKSACNLILPNTNQQSSGSFGLFLLDQVTKILFLFFIIFMTVKIFFSPLSGHDVLLYGAGGKIIYQQKFLPYGGSLFSPERGLYYFSVHGYNFQIHLVWELICGSFLGITSDHYFKSMSFFYGCSLFLVAGYWLNRWNRGWVWIGLFALLSAKSFYDAWLSFHIDAYRLCLLLISWTALAQAIRLKGHFSLFVFGLTAGLATNAHATGAIITSFSVLAYFLFIEESSWLKRFINVSWLVFYILLFGGSHYIIEIFLGNGWIFNPV